MQTLSLIERHPVLDLRLVLILALASGQHGRAFLIRQRETAGLGSVILRHIAGDTGTFCVKLPVLIEPDVLRREIHLNISSRQVINTVSVKIIGISPGIRFQIDRLPGDMAPGFYILTPLL